MLLRGACVESCKVLIEAARFRSASRFARCCTGGRPSYTSPNTHRLRRPSQPNLLPLGFKTETQLGNLGQQHNFSFGPHHAARPEALVWKPKPGSLNTLYYIIVYYSIL